MAYHKQEMDKGWAWVVLFCSWMSIFLTCFLTATAAILQVEIIEDLGLGAGPVSVMTSLSVGLASLLGPLSGIMASLFSARTTVFIGGILMSFGMLATSFSYSFSAMMIFYGIITGFGFGIAYSPIVVVISFYFEKHRMLANGIILCASGVGMLSLPSICRYIIDSHGWRFAFALNGAFMLHILVFAAAFFPTDMERDNMTDIPCLCFRKNTTKNEKNKNLDQKTNKPYGHCETDKIINENGSSYELKNVAIQSKKYDLILKSGLMIDSNSLRSKSQSQTLSTNGSLLNVTNTPHIPVYITDSQDIKKSFQALSNHADVSTTSETQIKNLEEQGNGVNEGGNFRKRTFSELSESSYVSTDTHISTQVIPQYGKFKFGQLRKGNKEGRSYLGSSLGWASAELGSSLMVPVAIKEIADVQREEKRSILEQLTRICKHKAVWILSMNSFFMISSYGIHSVHFPSFAESKGMSRMQVAQFYTVYGLVLMAGRLGGGLIFNKLNPPLCLLMFILQLLNGLFMGFAPFYATTPVGIYIMQASFGLCYGQSYMVMPAILAQILGVKDLAIAFGIIHLFMGIGYILAPIIAGFLYDVTGTYDIPYYIGGGVFIMGALILILMIFIKKEADANQNPPSKDSKKDNEENEKASTMKSAPLLEKETV